ncbi:WD40 repeat-like protein [Hyphopichia burtonii NRRL Y-1933]|uniref:DNA damage-binding protein CMR1 n=1 Tax=Hyphopichia burtonii NRRL Y-1933 TaxID=984485 RepID=A0A1E4RRF2_9ASCO|nr:WD40 repeat-like protein [Hyphopichia burtonii NRRL Y-1933]ODV69859.1 WD40 repeat-like protein [Hyphopichia burtonii NRRL Y-1933]
MAPLSDFEKQRQANIKRNKDLLRQLELDSLTDSISRDAKNAIEASKPPRKKTKTQASQRKPKGEQVPERRSRRLRGVNLDDKESKEYQEQLKKEEEARQRRQELQELRQTRLYGDFKLIDLVTDKLGALKNEDKVIKKESVKREEDESPVKEEDEEEISNDDEVLQLLKQLGDKFSAGDFYEIIKKKSIDYNDKVLASKRKEFDNLKVFERFDPLDIRITQERISSINFHPSKTDRVITAGDKAGHVGIWAVDAKSNNEDEPVITTLKPHGKTVSRIISRGPTQILSSSYDGSVRLMDLNKLNSNDLINVSHPYDLSLSDVAVSDINICKDDANLLYLTTLSGNFYQHDLRVPFKQIEPKSFLRLHDKKIGSFSINPNSCHQIATASLDRTLKIWDLRNVGKSTFSELDLDEPSPHPYGSYASRLSISCVDWNSDNRLVCNGYDDTINLFDFSGQDGSDKIITEWSDTYQPGIKSEDESLEEIPENFKPFTRIKHNCQTGRWVTILKSKWQESPIDGVQKFAIANMNRGIDIYDQKGQILAHLSDAEKVGAVPAVVGMHPTQNWVVGGSASGKLYLFE